MSRLGFHLRQYARYCWHARNAHGLHSPFVFELYEAVIGSDKYYQVFDELEEVRERMLYDSQLIHVEDLGGGSHRLSSPNRRVRDIAKHSISPPKICQLLLKLVDYFAPDTVLELGTCLGISTLYMASALKPGARLVSVEGSESLVQIARENLAPVSAQVELVQGDIQQELPKILARHPRIDMAYLDANHRMGPTLAYFEQLLPALHERSVVVLDDIRHSPEMLQAWDALRARPEVTLSLDLYHLGILFFQKKHPKQHFALWW